MCVSKAWVNRDVERYRKRPVRASALGFTHLVLKASILGAFIFCAIEGIYVFCNFLFG